MKCKAEYQRRAKPVTREWLHRQYIELRRDCPDIAAEVHRDAKTVWLWLKDFGIPTRPRGTGPKPKLFGSSNPFFGKRHTAELKKRMSDMAIADGRLPWGKNNPHPRPSGKNHPAWRGGFTPDRQAFYGTPAWKSASRKVWKRDNRTCQKCGKIHERGEPFDVHHIVPFECKELRAEASNLVLLCEPCHYWVHSKSNTGRIFIK